jgi:hypothetical protein
MSSDGLLRGKQEMTERFHHIVAAMIVLSGIAIIGGIGFVLGLVIGG